MVVVETEAMTMLRRFLFLLRIREVTLQTGIRMIFLGKIVVHAEDQRRAEEILDLRHLGHCYEEIVQSR